MTIREVMLTSYTDLLEIQQQLDEGDPRIIFLERISIGSERKGHFSASLRFLNCQMKYDLINSKTAMME